MAIEEKLDRVISLLEQLVNLEDLKERRLAERVAEKLKPPAGPNDVPSARGGPNGRAAVPNAALRQPEAERPPLRRRSTLSDLTLADPIDQERARAASVQFAIDNMTVPWSEAHMRAVLQYEQMLRDEYGEEAVLNLPWNKLSRGPDATR